MRTAFVICTRADSERLPNKPFRKINGIPLIEHLISRLQKTNIPIIIAYPTEQNSSYEYLKQFDNVKLYPSELYNDPLGRMYDAAKYFNLDTIIRVSHDKIFVERKDIESALFDFDNMGLEYLYGTQFTPGTGFEIIGFNALERAAEKFKDVEYIGYSVRSVTKKIYNFNPRHQRGSFRFLIDYEQDLKLFEVLFSKLGNDCGLTDAVKYLTEFPELKEINKQPVLSIYTCAFNAERFLDSCMDSVATLSGFKDFEYILIDDHSTDATCELMAKFALKHSNVTWYRNEKNLGLASSSNIALKKAKGKYIMRLDADDFFVKPHSVKDMIRKIYDEDLEAVYPDNYFGDFNEIQKGNEIHHAAGTLFDKAALTHVKFTDGLMGHDSLDLYLRAKDQLKIGYIEQPVFFYRQRSDSMSKTNLSGRRSIKQNLLKTHSEAVKLNGFNDFYFNPFEQDNLEFDNKEIGLDIEQ